MNRKINDRMENNSQSGRAESIEGHFGASLRLDVH